MELLIAHKETKISRPTPTAPSLLLTIETSKTLNPKPSLQGFESRARVQSFRMSGAYLLLLNAVSNGFLGPIQTPKPFPECSPF